MQELRRVAHLPPLDEPSHLPLLRLHLPRAEAVPQLREHRTARSRLRHGEDRGPRARTVPRGTHRPHGPRHHAVCRCLRTHHRRLLLRQNRHTHRHADDNQGARLLGRHGRRHTQRRHHAQLSRLPCLRAGVSDALAGERQSWQARRARTRHTADQECRPARDTAGRGGRLPDVRTRLARRAQHVPLSAVLPPRLCLSAPPQRAARRQCRHRDGFASASGVRRPRVRPRQAGCGTCKDRVDTQDCHQARAGHQPAARTPVHGGSTHPTAAGQTLRSHDRIFRCRPKLTIEKSLYKREAKFPHLQLGFYYICACGYNAFRELFK